LSSGRRRRWCAEANKNDYLDAEAIAEAVTRKKLRFVPIKTEDQLDVQGLHRVRERLVHNRTGGHQSDSRFSAGARGHVGNCHQGLGCGVVFEITP
jgi:Transposase